MIAAHATFPVNQISEARPSSKRAPIKTARHLRPFRSSTIASHPLAVYDVL
jgi:hypothetical protein